VDIVDEAFLAVPRQRVASVFADQTCWSHFWPDLELAVYADRGAEGLRWTVSGALVGTMEVWLESVLDGTVLHYFLRADRCGADGRPVALAATRAKAEIRRRHLAAKDLAFDLKLVLEAGREPGCPPPPGD
jgi:hypothetical protein